MKNCFFPIIFFFFLSNGLVAQLGFSVSPTLGYSDNWQVLVENYITNRQTDFFRHCNTATVDYTFQLNDSAWQIRPAIHAMRSHNIYQEHDFEAYTIGLQGNINYAPFLDKDADQAKTILYFQLSPGIDYVHLRYFKTILEEGLPVERIHLVSKKIAFNAGLNVLLQFKLTNFLSISPTAGIRYFPNLEWAGFSNTISDGTFSNEFDRVNWRLFTYGVRIGLNLTEGK